MLVSVTYILEGRAKRPEGHGMTQPDTHGAPTPPRRSVLAGGAGAALGISTLALPSAAVAASPGGGGGSGTVAAVAEAPDLTGTTTLAYWNEAASKGAADVLDASVASGAFSVGNGWPAPTGVADFPYWDGPFSNLPSNSASSLDPDSAPYVAWSITTDAAVQLAAFGLPKATLGLTDNDLTLTFRCSIDDYATTIREVTAVDRSGAAGDRYTLLVNLEGLSFIPADTTFELRMYLHGGSLGKTSFEDETIGGGTDYPAYETDRDESQTEWEGFSHVQVFLGTTI